MLTQPGLFIHCEVYMHSKTVQNRKFHSGILILVSRSFIGFSFDTIVSLCFRTLGLPPCSEFPR
jgi:hypothetical protein